VGHAITVFIQFTLQAHPTWLSIHGWIGAIDDGFGHRWRRNGEFCIAVGPFTRTVVTVAYCSLIIGSALAGSKVRGDELVATDLIV